MSKMGHNCNLCKRITYLPQVGLICFGDKNRGKIIDNNDAICDEYEFGGFIDLAERLTKISEGVSDIQNKLFT